MQDWSVTEDKIAEAVRRIVAAADPLQIILFGSRARGDHRPESDLDLAVILDTPDDAVRQRLPQTVLRGLRMEVNMIVASKTKYDLYRPWLNSVFYYIDQEGVILYDRAHPESAGAHAVRVGLGRRIDATVPAA